MKICNKPLKYNNDKSTSSSSSHHKNLSKSSTHTRNKDDTDLSK